MLASHENFHGWWVSSKPVHSISSSISAQLCPHCFIWLHKNRRQGDMVFSEPTSSYLLHGFCIIFQVPKKKKKLKSKKERDRVKEAAKDSGKKPGDKDKSATVRIALFWRHWNVVVDHVNNRNSNFTQCCGVYKVLCVSNGCKSKMIWLDSLCEQIDGSFRTCEFCFDENDVFKMQSNIYVVLCVFI